MDCQLLKTRPLSIQSRVFSVFLVDIGVIYLDLVVE